MIALRFDSHLAIENVPTPVIKTGEALLEVHLAGICNTDIEITKGYMGFTGILGHEFVAEVIEGPSDFVGKRVVGEINVASAQCDYCDRNIKSHCRNRTTVGIDRHDGAFANYMRLTTQNLHIVPNNVTDEQAVFTEPLAAACRILEQIDITSDDNIVVIGAGKLGMLCAQVLAQTDASLSVIVRHDKQAELLQKWGIKAVRRSDLQESSATVVVDCTGNESGFADALDIVQPLGKIVLKSTYEGQPKADLTRLVIDEITLVGSRCGPFSKALDYLEQGLVDVDSMIDATYPLEDALTAMDYASQKGVLKVLLRP